jgi:membrane associated rhomboid family serine protease
VIDILPTLALCSEQDAFDRKNIRIWMLVLQSRGILCRVNTGPELLVAPAMARTALAEIMAYEHENRKLPRPAPLPDNSWVSLLLVGSFVLFTLWLEPQSGLRPEWYAQGRADAALIVGGEWWRCVTALCLHADAGHLLSNAASSVLLGILLSRRLGSGLTWGLFVLTGGLGNAVNAWVQGAGHISVGASTGVFGLIGVLAGSAGRRDFGSRRRSLLLSFGFGLSLFAMLGTGEERVDVGAHLFGLLCGLPFGALCGQQRGTASRRKWLNPAAGVSGAVTILAAWRLAVAGC